MGGLLHLRKRKIWERSHQSWRQSWENEKLILGKHFEYLNPATTGVSISWAKPFSLLSTTTEFLSFTTFSDSKGDWLFAKWSWLSHYMHSLRAFLVGQMIKTLPAIQETWVQSLGQEAPLEKGMVTYSNILSWRIPWTKEPDGLQSMGLQRVWHDWAINTHAHTQE